MCTTARSVITTVLDITRVVKTVPQALYSRLCIATRQTVQTMQTRHPRHHRHHATAPQATMPCVMLVANDITDKGYDIFP